MHKLVGFRGRFLVPVNQPPISDGLIVASDERIVDFGPFSQTSRKFPGLMPRDLGDVAIIPGLVNAHTHLEFSDLTAPLGASGISFTEWISLVMKYRADRESDKVDSRIETGLRELMDCRTAAAGEISNVSVVPDLTFAHEHSQNKALRALPEIVSFYELIGSSDERMEMAKRTALHHLKLSTESNSWQPALSPHAPYSCHISLLAWACQQSLEVNVPIAMHLAETREEVQFLKEKQGPFREMLETMGVWNAESMAEITSPLDYLKRLATASRSLVVHGNYLSDEEIKFVSVHRDTMSVVFCPRTHAFFQHQGYPLQKMLNAGVPVTLGTDSRASNPDLSIWNEAKYVAANFPELDPAKILEMVTMVGAVSLGVNRDFGSIDIGKRAVFKVFRCEGVSKNRIIEHLFDAE